MSPWHHCSFLTDCCVTRVSFSVDPGKLTVCIVKEPEQVIQGIFMPAFFVFFIKITARELENTKEDDEPPLCAICLRSPYTLQDEEFGTIIHLHSGDWEQNNPSHSPCVCCMLIVPSDTHLHNGTAKKRLSRLILLMQLDYCLCACDNQQLKAQGSRAPLSWPHNGMCDF